MLICRAWLTAKVGAWHRKPQQPVLKTGLKSPVQSQAERESDALGERPGKVCFLGIVTDRPGSLRRCQLPMLPEQKKHDV